MQCFMKLKAMYQIFISIYEKGDKKVFAISGQYSVWLYNEVAIEHEKILQSG